MNLPVELNLRIKRSLSPDIFEAPLHDDLSFILAFVPGLAEDEVLGEAPAKFMRDFVGEAAGGVLAAAFEHMALPTVNLGGIFMVDQIGVEFRVKADLSVQTWKQLGGPTWYWPWGSTYEGWSSDERLKDRKDANNEPIGMPIIESIGKMAVIPASSSISIEDGAITFDPIFVLKVKDVLRDVQAQISAVTPKSLKDKVAALPECKAGMQERWGVKWDPRN